VKPKFNSVTLTMLTKEHGVEAQRLCANRPRHARQIRSWSAFALLFAVDRSNLSATASGAARVACSQTGVADSMTAT
jgi:hypothetical protein